MKSKKVLVVGISGRMGQEVLRLCQSDPQLEVSYGVAKHSDPVEGVCLEADFSNISPGDVDVVIDFSSPEIFLKALRWCVSVNVPLVSGTTGLSPAQEQALSEASKTLRVLWAPNMSLGIAFFRRLIGQFKSLSNWDFQLEEVHHRYKKDRPSGTAVLLQKVAQEVVAKSLPDVNVTRAGGVFGIHRMLAASEDELMTVQHEALNRTVFARGAITAAKWLIEQKQTGLYDIQDVLEN